MGYYGRTVMKEATSLARRRAHAMISDDACVEVGKEA
jgi:hypothetical protein